MKQPVIIIAALSPTGIIGKGNELPWHIPEDLQHFKLQTSGQTVIMGENTFHSMGKALPNRQNIVISPKLESNESIHVCRTLDSALETAQRFGKRIFIIGGAFTYEKALPFADFLYISHLKKDYEGDVYFPILNFDDWIKASSKEFDSFVFTVYKRK
ncbi:MAG: dihydrofolate reductase [Candidatus Neomarinimicrobiota bacterium]|nr:dihydrofolate reductase [Candidatus Neomarinimicrobiota bacterium]MDX9781141.1 dihydrofolate reductase [bacterium]